MTELNLQKKFLSIIKQNKTPWGNLQWAEQFFFNGGRTDVIAKNNTMLLYAFELKLEKWKKALNQAYRNTNFANKSYVVLPKEIANKAYKHRYQFERRSVGICYIEGNKIIELLDPALNEPTLTWLNNKALNTIGESFGHK